MKRLLTLIVAVAMTFAAYPVFASVNNSAHDFLGSQYGRCGTCHVPHAASSTTASRLWRADLTISKDGSWTGSTVGTLCGYCHKQGGGQTIPNAAGTQTSTVPYHANSPAFATTSHGRTIDRLTGAPLNHALSSDATARPYMTSGHQAEAGLMECTSCHNPHNEGVNGESGGIRPFLIAGATEATRTSGFCNDCHDDRYTAATNSSSNHPVLIQYNPSDSVDMRVMKQADANMNVPVPTAIPISNWSLGGKFEGNVDTIQGAVTSELIGCQSCHAIHGQDGTARTTPAVETNAPGGPDYSGGGPRQLLALGYANDAICEGCHMADTRANGGTVGGQGADHPFDLALSNVMVLDGALWTATEHGSNGGAICTSCHKAHGASVEMIRRAGDTVWCTSCHTSVAPAAHHSNNIQLATSNVGCNSCHDISGTGAHNGFDFAFKLAASGGCQTSGCHGTADPVNENNAILANIPNSHLTAKTGFDASHFIGTFTNDAAAHTKGINAKIGAWTASGDRSTRTSKYLLDAGGNPLVVGASSYNPNVVAGSSTTMVVRCESCHSVLGNIGRDAPTVSSGWMNNLLLQDYQDDSKGDGFGVNSDFCIGCHNKVNGDDATAKLGTVAGLVGSSLEKNSAITPPGIHPMTLATISKAVDAGRTTTTLITDKVNGYANASGAPDAPGVGASDTSYYAVDHMDCDSCHRPHLGKLNWNATNQTVTPSRGNVPVILEDGSADSFAPLCQDCHNY